MKKRIQFILFLGTILIPFSVKGQQIENAVSEIRDNTGQTALHTKKGGYEYLSIAISVLAFITALTTLYYTFYTYRSQKAIQKNTTPVITQDNQIETLYNIALKLLDNFEKSMAIRIKMEHCADNEVISPINLISQIIPTENIHVELFYGETVDVRDILVFDIGENSKYGNITKVKEELTIYNHALMSIAKEFTDLSIDLQYKKEIFGECILDKSLQLLISIHKSITNIYGKEYDVRRKIIEKAYFTMLILTSKDSEFEVSDFNFRGNNLELFNEFNSGYWGVFLKILTLMIFLKRRILTIQNSWHQLQ